MNAAAPPAEGGGNVGEFWRQATSAEGKVSDLFGKHLIDAPEFSPAVEEALKLVRPQPCLPQLCPPLRHVLSSPDLRARHLPIPFDAVQHVNSHFPWRRQVVAAAASAATKDSDTEEALVFFRRSATP